MCVGMIMLKMFATVLRAYPAAFAIVCLAGAIGGLILNMFDKATWRPTTARVSAVSDMCDMDAEIYSPRRGREVFHERVACSDVDTRKAAHFGITFQVTRDPLVRLTYQVADGAELETETTALALALPVEIDTGQVVALQYKADAPATLRQPIEPRGTAAAIIGSICGILLAALALFGRKAPDAVERSGGKPDNAYANLDFATATPAQRLLAKAARAQELKANRGDRNAPAPTTAAKPATSLRLQPRPPVGRPNLRK
jgi:hypothetical protein